jgi:cytochrome P450
MLFDTFHGGEFAVSTKIETQLDLSSDEHLHCPHARLKQMRENTPLFRNELDGAWIVTRQKDILALLAHPDLSPDIRKSRDCPLQAVDPDSLFMQFVANNVFAKEGEEHRRLRRFASMGFSTRVVRKLEDRLTRIIEETFLGFEGRDEIDFSEEVTQILPTTVIGTLLNFPRDRWYLFTELSADVLINYVPMGSLDEKLAAVERYNDNAAKFVAIVDERRECEDSSDFLSLLLRAEEEGHKINTEEAISLIVSMVMGAADTITDFVNQALLTLLRHPEQQAVALQSDEALDSAILESARHHYFVRFGHNRYALRDFKYEGNKVAKGESVRLMFDSAGRDAEVYEYPDSFDVTRNQKSNIAFGHGRHFCPGASLAKLQTRIILRLFFRYFPDASLAGEPSYDIYKNTRRYQHLPVSLIAE